MKRNSPEATAPHVAVTINGTRWRRVGSLAASGPRDRHFTTTTDADGSTTVSFGDGAHGATPRPDASIGVRLRRARARRRPVRASSGTPSSPTTDRGMWISIRNTSDGIAFHLYRR